MFCLGLWQGLLLGIDAEFVALSASEKGSREDGVEFVKRPARLSLARVSVVRGEGDKAGVCCIDDYICMVTFITAADKEASLRYF
jgi:PAB-dependent poly(A)-specific ribonuclease subunit 2